MKMPSGMYRIEVHYQSMWDIEHNADCIRAIAKVFPILFFIVAVFNQLDNHDTYGRRTENSDWNVKSFGLWKAEHCRKILKLCPFATVGGSIFGVLFGEKVFPYIIVTAYKIMYTHVPDVVNPYNWEYQLRQQEQQFYALVWRYFWLVINRLLLNRLYL